MRSTARVAEPGPGLVRVVLTALAVAAAVVLVPAPSDAAAPADGATLSGRLVVADGAPWDDTPWIVSAVPVDAGGQEVDTTATASGTFALDDVPAGSYRIRAVPAEEHTDVPAMWHGDTLDEAAATVVQARPGAELGGLDVTLLSAEELPRRASGNGTPYVKGTPKVGWTLTAEPQEWQVEDDWLGHPLPVTPDLFTFQWLADGVAVPGATAKTFAPTARELGARISVRIGIDVPGTVLTTPDTSREYGPVVAGRNTACSRVTLAGTAKVGRTLTARSTCWTAPGTRVTHTWFVDGRKVGTTTRPTIRLRKAYRGDRVSVKVTAKAPGYATTSVRPPARKVR